MADRVVNVKLDGDSRGYVSAADRAANATDKLQGKADKFGRTNAQAKVGIDGAAKATSEVTALKQKLDSLERKYTAQFNMNSRGAQRDVALILNSITALGPAAVAAAGVAGGALLGLGATVGAVAAGLAAGALALEGVGEAYKKLQTYQDDPTDTNLDNLNDALAKLSQTGKDFVYFVDREWSPAMDKLQANASDNFLPGLTDGMRNLQVIMPQVSNLVTETSQALSDLARDGSRSLTDPFWQDYINFVATNAGPTLTTFWRITENLGRGVASLQMAFNPMARDVMGGLEGMTDRFARWSDSLTMNAGFKGFISYIIEMAPRVFDTIGAIAGAIGDIAVAAAPLGGPVLAVIKGLADTLGFIASIPGVGVTLLAAAGAMGMLNLALRAIEITKFSRIGQFIGDLGGKTDRAALSMGVFTEKLTGSAAAGEKVMTGTSKLAGVMNNMGPILAGVAGAIALIGWQYELNRSKATDFADAVVTGSMSMQEAIAKEEEVIKGRSAIGHLFSGTINEATDAQARHVTATQSVTNALIAQTWATDPVIRASAAAKLAQVDWSNAVAQYGAESGQAVGASNRFGAATRDVEIAQIMARDGVDRMTASVIYQNNVMNGAVSADMAAERAMLTYEQTTARATVTLQQHSASSIEGRDAILGVKESAVQAATAAGQKAEADAVAAGRSDGANLSAQAQRQTYLDLAAKTKEPLRSELQALADRVSTLPDGNFTVTGTGLISDKIKMADGTEIPILTSSLGRGGAASAGRLATGGFVEDVLPGYTPGRDPHVFSGPAGTLALSGGEAIMRPEVTRAVGRSGIDALNTAARRGGVAGVRKRMAFRNGGVFGSGVQPFPDVANVLQADMSDLLTRAIQPPLYQMVQDTGSQMFGGGDVMAWARGQAGKPYIWGGVGPIGYDCSGFISALTNVARGLPPHQRIGSTASFPWPGFVPGLGAGLQVGSSPNTGGGIGHMAATLNGVNLESAGGVGVRVGGPVGAASAMFGTKATLPMNAMTGKGAAGAPGGSGQWNSTILQALALLGLPSSLLGTTARRLQQESGGNPRAINNWDSNASRGTPSKGLMQVIDPTFAANWDGRTPKDIWNPLSNIVASMKYAIRRYGSLPAAYDRAGGYADGGVIPGARGSRDDRYVLAQAGERVLSRAQNRAFEDIVSAISQPRRVGYTPAPAAGSASSGGRSLTINNENHFRETVDLDLFNQRQEFAIQGAGL